MSQGKRESTCKKEWSSVEIFRAVSTGNDYNLPDSFVEHAAYTELLTLAREMREALSDALIESEKLDKNGCDCLSQRLERKMNDLKYKAAAVLGDEE